MTNDVASVGHITWSEPTLVGAYPREWRMMFATWDDTGATYRIRLTTVQNGEPFPAIDVYLLRRENDYLTVRDRVYYSLRDFGRDHVEATQVSNDTVDVIYGKNTLDRLH